MNKNQGRRSRRRTAAALAVASFACAIGGTVYMQPSHAAPIPGDSRNVVAQAYQDYMAAAAVSENNDANPDACYIGSIPTATRLAAEKQINIIRGLAKVNSITIDPAYEKEAQWAAVVMAAQGQISHDPPTTWPCMKEANYMSGLFNYAQDAAKTSNLSIHNLTANHYYEYMKDAGVPSLGHRRWMIDPTITTMGLGTAVDNTPNTYNFPVRVNVLKVVKTGRAPATDIPSGIAWPAAGYFPIQMADGMWSWSGDKTHQWDFSNTVVRVYDPSDKLQVVGTPDPLGPNMGPDTIGWPMPALVKPEGAASSDYRVVLENVVRNGQVQPTFSYTVKLIDGTVMGPADPTPTAPVTPTTPTPTDPTTPPEPTTPTQDPTTPTPDPTTPTVDPTQDPTTDPTDDPTQNPTTPTTDPTTPTADPTTPTPTGPSTSTPPAETTPPTTTPSPFQGMRLGMSFSDPNNDGVAQLGETLSFTIGVTNTSGQELSGLSVEKSTSMGGATTGCTSNNVAVDGTATCTASYTVTQSDVDNGNVTGTFRTVATAANGAKTFSDTYRFSLQAAPMDTSTPTEPPHVEPAITLGVLPVGFDTNENGVLDVGDSVHFIFVANNLSDKYTLTDAYLESNDFPRSDCVASLPENATAECSYSYVHVITQEDMDRGFYDLTATLNASYSNEMGSGVVKDTVTTTVKVGVPQEETPIELPAPPTDTGNATTGDRGEAPSGETSTGTTTNPGLPRAGGTADNIPGILMFLAAGSLGALATLFARKS